MDTPRRVALSFWQGESWAITVACVDSSGQPLAASAAALRIVSKVGVVIDQEVTTNSSGVAVFVVTPDQQAEAGNPVGPFVYEIRAFPSEGIAFDQQRGVLCSLQSLFVSFAFTPPDSAGQLDGADPDQSGWTLGH